MGEPRDLIGRDHHVDGYTMWLAGGGIKGGQTIGATDELGYYAVEDPHPRPRPAGHDPAPAGPGPLKLTYRFQGRDFRLTDVAGNVVAKMLA